MPFLVGQRTEEELFQTLKDFLTGVGRPVSVAFAGAGNGWMVDTYIDDANKLDYYELECVTSETYGGQFEIIRYNYSDGYVTPTLLGTFDVSQVIDAGGLNGYITFGTTDFQLGDLFTVKSVETSIASGSSKPTYDVSQLATFNTTIDATIAVVCTTASQSNPYVPAVFSVDVTPAVGAPYSLSDYTQGTVGTYDE
ncbi:MAG: hypothetical protein KDD43_12145, partial [Bdellovibrionales bacterium]|nr:hypothetical protein [Bdellovibrionales bacterium]